MSDRIEPFRIAATDDQLDDLRRRLRATRFPERECVDDWSQGIPLAYVQDLCAYWAEKYDWRAREARLNRFAQFKTEIDGVDIHFIHARSPHANAMPLVISARLARLDRRVPQGDRAAHESDRARRRRARRVPRRRALAARLRLLGQARAHRLERAAHRARVVAAHAAPRLRALRRAGRRLGRDGDDLHRHPGP